jgi:5-(carboxyamino)imidazole ribonucleotide synthase
VESESQLVAAVRELGRPSVLKTAAFGYDGKGQRKITADTSLTAVWSEYRDTPAVLEAWVPFAREISVIVARCVRGQRVSYPVCENRHANHILDLTLVPAELPAEVTAKARMLAEGIAEEIGLIGVLAVEMFLLPDDQILVNELAPRPHNSGHFSFDASITSQFEQQLRAVCGLPLGSAESLRPCAMANLLGDLWTAGEPDWSAVASFPEVKIHLYGKAEARPGRKMGHLVGFGATAAEAADRVEAARAAATANDAKS